MTAIKKVVEKMYGIIFPDYGAEITDSFRFKLFIVLLSGFMVVSAVATYLLLV